jgi:hypothetical protein
MTKRKISPIKKSPRCRSSNQKCKTDEMSSAGLALDTYYQYQVAMFIAEGCPNSREDE